MVAGTVLVVGATGNIGVAAVQAALRSQRSVLAIVRNQNSADKLFQHVGTRDGITTVEADILSDQGVQKVVDLVKAGKLPSFQHVYSTGQCPKSSESWFVLSLIREFSWRLVFTDSLEGDERQRNARDHGCQLRDEFRATIPYLLEQGYPESTWTICTGSQGDLGQRAGPAMSQGALFSMSNAACVELAGTNIRFNEVYLALRVEVDTVASQTGAMKSSDFSLVYEEILSRPEIKSSRVYVHGPKDLKDLKYKKKIDSA